MTIAADQVFVKIPARGFERTLARCPFIEGMRVRALELCFRRERKTDFVFAVRGLYDGIGTSRLLATEIIRLTPDDPQPARVVARPKLLQTGILRCVAAERSRVDHEDRPAGVLNELDVCACSRPNSRSGPG